MRNDCFYPVTMCAKTGYERSLLLIGLCLLLLTGCSHFGHYPVNAPLTKYDPGYGYIGKNTGTEGNSEELLLILTFSGGGTRAAAFSYGALEELRATEVTLGGKKRRLARKLQQRHLPAAAGTILCVVRRAAHLFPHSRRADPPQPAQQPR